MTANSAVSTAKPVAAPATGSIRIRLRAPSRLRNIELMLLLFACAINASAIIMVQLGFMGSIDWSLATLGFGLSILVFAMHIALRIVATNADPFILPIATVLNGLGIAMIYRLDLGDGLEGWDAAGIRQIAWTAIAMTLAIVVIAVLRNHRVLQKYRFTAMLIGGALLILPALPFFRPVNGAHIWIQIGPLNFQPAEVGKIALPIAER